MKNSFIELVLAYLKGDEAEAKAIRIQKRGAAILKCEISVLESNVLKQQDKVEQAKENLMKATINNGSAEFEEDKYMSGLVKAQNEFKTAQNELEALEKKLAFFKERMAFVQGDEAKVSARK